MKKRIWGYENAQRTSHRDAVTYLGHVSLLAAAGAHHNMRVRQDIGALKDSMLAYKRHNRKKKHLKYIATRHNLTIDPIKVSMHKSKS